MKTLLKRLERCVRESRFAQWLGNPWLHLVLVVVAGGAGVWGLGHATSWWIAGAVLAVAVLAAFARFNEVAGRLAGGLVCGTLALFGFNVGLDSLVDALGWERYSIILGLALALLVFGFAAAWYLRGAPAGHPPEVGSQDVAEPRHGALSRGARWPVWPTAVAASTLAVVSIIVVPILVQRGADSALAAGGGLLVGLGLCWGGHALYCRGHEVGGAAMAAAGVLAIGLLPLMTAGGGDHGDVPAEEDVASLIDVRIITDGRTHPPPPKPAPDPALAGFKASYSVGYAGDDGQVHWTLIGGDAPAALRVAALGRAAPTLRAAPQRNAAPVALTRPATRPGADTVLVLLVDGTPPVVVGDPADLEEVRPRRERVGYWRAIAHLAREPRMPTFALIQSADPRRLTAWDHFRVSGGGYVSLQKLGRSGVTDAGLALAIGSPTSLADGALAVAHRPILLFDSKEPVPRPLSIEWLFDQGLVRLCHDDGRRSACDEQALKEPAELRNGRTHLALELPEQDVLKELALQEQRAVQARTPAPEGQPQARLADDDPQLGAAPAATPEAAVAPTSPSVPTAVYVHPVSVDQNGRQLLYLDYWWFLQDNPVVIGKKAFCGAGLVIPGKTCHSHASDWEGMTVVIDRTSGTPKVKAVQYAQHNEVVAFPWETLREGWQAMPGARAAIAVADNGAHRPLAFVAQGTHSTYPQPCGSPDCKQLASGSTGEARYDGRLPWIGNFTNACGAISCVQPLPTRTGGSEPALWNAFAGNWGKRHCVLTFYCDTVDPPPTPGRQKRYLHPTRCTGQGSWDPRAKAFKYTKGSCDQ